MGLSAAEAPTGGDPCKNSVTCAPDLRSAREFTRQTGDRRV